MKDTPYSNLLHLVMTVLCMRALLQYVNVFMFNSVQPIMTALPSSQAVTLVTNQQRFSMTCEALGASSYSWQRKDGDISSSATGVHSGILTFTNLQLEDAGNYRCVAICKHTGYSFSNYSTLTLAGMRNKI